MLTTTSYREALLASQRDPEKAAWYLTEVASSGDFGEFLDAVYVIVNGRVGGIRVLAKEMNMTVEVLSHLLSKEKNPKLIGVTTILEKLGLVIAIIPKKLN